MDMIPQRWFYSCVYFNCCFMEIRNYSGIEFFGTKPSLQPLDIISDVEFIEFYVLQ